MTARENLLSLYRRKGYERAPVHFHLCPHLQEEFRKHYPGDVEVADVFGFPTHNMTDPGFPWIAEIPGFVPARKWNRAQYFATPIHPGARIDIWGIVHEPGSAAAQHMTHMRHPLQRMESLEQFKAYPWPDFTGADWSFLKPEMDRAHARGLAVLMTMECTVWETAWYLRGMTELMTDMACEDEKAAWLLDLITERACFRAAKFAEAGTDVLAVGDDVGMQQTIMMSQDMYRQWLKPRLARVIAAAKKAKPDIIIQYHSCGFVTPLIQDLVDAGVDVLNPVQPECMDFAEIHAQFADRLSFNGTIGTQTTMPFGTPEEVRREVWKNLRLAGKKGGLFACPTHMLEPEVPWENVEAYAKACREFTP